MSVGTGSACSSFSSPFSCPGVGRLFFFSSEVGGRRRAWPNSENVWALPMSATHKIKTDTRCHNKRVIWSPFNGQAAGSAWMNRNIGCARKPGQAGWIVGRGLERVMRGNAGAFPDGEEGEEGKDKGKNGKNEREKRIRIPFFLLPFLQIFNSRRPLPLR